MFLYIIIFIVLPIIDISTLFTFCPKSDDTESDTNETNTNETNTNETNTNETNTTTEGSSSTLGIVLGTVGSSFLLIFGALGYKKFKKTDLDTVDAMDEQDVAEMSTSS